MSHTLVNLALVIETLRFVGCCPR